MTSNSTLISVDICIFDNKIEIIVCLFHLIII